MSIRVLLRRPDPVLIVVALWLLAWPVAHVVITRALDVSPWRLGGWAMYATPTPRTSDVVIAVRKCDVPRLGLAPPDGRPTALVFDDDGGRRGGLAVDHEGRERARDLAAFRGRDDVVAFDAWLRSAHGIGHDVPIAYAVVERRLDPRRGRAFGHARVTLIVDGDVVERRRFIASAARLATVLPGCGRV